MKTATPETVELARMTALRLHGAQLYGNVPYGVHLAAVVEVLIRFGLATPLLLAAAWLHDVLEDLIHTRATPAILAALGIPDDVIELVLAVTDEPGPSRRERKARTYPKIAVRRAAVALKLADRIANVEAADAKILAMYRREYADFRTALHKEEHDLEAMWLHLDALLSV